MSGETLEELAAAIDTIGLRKFLNEICAGLPPGLVIKPHLENGYGGISLEDFDGEDADYGPIDEEGFAEAIVRLMQEAKRLDAIEEESQQNSTDQKPQSVNLLG